MRLYQQPLMHGKLQQVNPRACRVLIPQIPLRWATFSQGDNKLFMMKHPVGNIASMEACEAACHADPTAFLGKQQSYASYVNKFW